MACPSQIIQAYNSKDYCDLVITCGDMKWVVHKVVVCTASPFFRNACNFAVGKEAEDKCIDLPEDDPEMIQRLITYFYKHDYEPTSIHCLDSLEYFNDSAVSANPASIYHNIFSVTTYFDYVKKIFVDPSMQPVTDNSACACIALITPLNQVNQPIASVPPNLPNIASLLVRPRNAYQIKQPLTTHATMYALADKYFVEPLGVCAKDKFTNSLADHWDSEDFIAAVQIVYHSTPAENRGLRDVVLRAFQDYFKINISEIPGAEDKLVNIDELSFLLMKSWSSKGC